MNPVLNVHLHRPRRQAARLVLADKLTTLSPEAPNSDTVEEPFSPFGSSDVHIGLQRVPRVLGAGERYGMMELHGPDSTTLRRPS
jgi:hypothetical protein